MILQKSVNASLSSAINSVTLEKQENLKENLQNGSAVSVGSSESSNHSMKEISLDYSSPSLQQTEEQDRELNFIDSSMLRPTPPQESDNRLAVEKPNIQPLQGHSPVPSFMSTASTNISSSKINNNQTEFEQLRDSYKSHGDLNSAINDSRIQSIIFELNQQCEKESIPVSNIDWLQWASVPLFAYDLPPDPSNPNATSSSPPPLTPILELIKQNNFCIPSPCRKLVWQSLVSAERNELLTLYATLSTTNNSLDSSIRKIIRMQSFRGPLEPFKYSSTTRHKVSTESIFHVLHAFTLFDTTVEYNIEPLLWLTCAFLSYMPQGNAFRSLVCFIQRGGIREFFISQSSSLDESLFALVWGCLGDLAPSVAISLQRIKVSSLCILYPSLACCFADSLQLPEALRLMDLIAIYGLEMFVRLLVAIFLKDRDKIVNMVSHEQWVKYLRSDILASYRQPLVQKYTFYTRTPVDLNALVEDSLALNIDTTQFPSYLSYHETSVSHNTYRQNNLEELKNQNDYLTSQITNLEEGMVMLNKENTKLSEALSNHRVTRSEMEEATEILKNNSADLKAQLEKQPQELENRLLQEISILKQRNQKFLKNNATSIQQIQYLDEELGKTLKQLNDLKEKHAQLQTKWKSVSEMFRN